MQRLWRQPGFARLNAVAFLNAWVDLGHKITVQNTIFAVYDGPLQVALTGLVNMLILLPYIYLMGPAGRWSDAYPKARVLEVSAGFAAIVMAIITLFYALGWFWPAFALTLVLAMQAAVFAPAKLGFLREGVPAEQLTRANGTLQAITMIAMLATMLGHSLLFDHQLAGRETADPSELLSWLTPVGGFLLVAAVLEWWLARPLGRLGGSLQPARPVLAATEDDGFRREVARLAAEPVIWGATLGLAAFWALAQGLVAVYPSWAEDTLGITSVTRIQLTVAAASVGVVFGSVAAGRLAETRIPLGLVPIGAAGVTLCLMGLPWLPGPAGQALLFGGLGAFGGLLVVPLETLIQYHAEPDRLGRTLAASNVVRNIIMVGLLLLTMAAALTGFDADWLLAGLMLGATVGLLAALRQLPHALATLLLQLALAGGYRLEITGLDRLPNRGGVLLLGNHVSWIDWAIVWLACPRPVRFVMSRGVYRRWYWRWVLDLARVLPISPGGAHGSMRLVADCLARGEVVCLFPEGTLSRHGQLNPFRSGFERALALLPAEAGVQVVPFFLRGLWGSRFSNAMPGSARQWGRLRRRVVVAFGTPLQREVRAAEVRAAVVELGHDAWQAHVHALPTLAVAALRSLSRGRARPAVIDDTVGVTLSRGRLAAAALCLARVLARGGRVRGERVGLLLPPGAGSLLMNLAVLFGGGRVVNLNYSWSTAQVLDAIQRAGVQRVVTARRFRERLAHRGFEVEALTGAVDVVDLEDLRSQVKPTGILVALLLLRLLPAGLLAALSGAETRDNRSEAALLFSSGSEGRAKGVRLSHAALQGNVEQCMQVLDARPGDRLLGCLPAFHAFGLTVCSLLPVLQGMPVVTVADPTRPLDLARAIARHRASILFSTPTLLRLMLRQPRLHPLLLGSLRLLVAGAERLDPATAEAFLQRFSKAIHEGYGCTETGPVACVNVPDCLEPEDLSVHLGSRPGTVGMPLPGTCLRVVDPQTLEELPVGSAGEVLIGGPQVMLGYLDDTVASERVFLERDGRRWYRTGDQGRLDADGFLTIVDRYSRFAKIGGEMISLTELEGRARAAMLRLEWQAEVAAVSLADDRRGESIVLLYAATLEAPDSAELRRALLEVGCPPIALPAAWLPVEDLPRLGSGKPDLQAARRLAEEVLGSSRPQRE
jgi:acyl-[acyl-carrier-protein]-phospholipid O-acyltransferase / long-chain-fatty-acid--[acyl-carrier-protein] ligase